MAKPYKTTREVCIGDDVYTVTAWHNPYYPGIYEKGGGQITPDEPEHYEILSVKKNGIPFDPSNELEEQLAQLLLEQDYA